MTLRRSRVRARRYEVPVVDYRRTAGRVRARSKVEKLVGQSFGAAGRGRVLSELERLEIERQMKQSGLLP
jgi:hypothetical protein